MDDYIAMQFPKLPPHIRHLYREETMPTSPEWVSEKKPTATEQRVFFIIRMHHNMNMVMYRYAYVIYNHTSKLYGL